MQLPRHLPSSNRFYLCPPKVEPTRPAMPHHASYLHDSISVHYPRSRSRVHSVDRQNSCPWSENYRRLGNYDRLRNWDVLLQKNCRRPGQSSVDSTMSSRDVLDISRAAAAVVGKPVFFQLSQLCAALSEFDFSFPCLRGHTEYESGAKSGRTPFQA